ncbi:MAG: F420-dependent glucose-6-phosphate dehydrogenase [Anaerolineae bacterium]|nr:F420-dependent glucose-6-phosphate dehydrogenase [Anaerolineae bacterium]
MEFAFTFKGNFNIQRSIEITQAAEYWGFNYCWAFDSHVLWKDCYPVFSLLAWHTNRMKFGTCVTNPAVRDITVTASLFATLNEISGNRMVLGIGRGDSSRRVIGKKPTTVAQLKEASLNIRELVEGREIDYEGVPTRLEWARGNTLPLWIAGYGPKVLRSAGTYADGIIMQFADPHLIKWCMSHVHEGAREAGRDPSKIQVMAASPVWVSDDIDKGREQVRWFPAMVGNHVADLVQRYDDGTLPAELTAYIKGRKGYNYRKHADKESESMDFVTNEVIDRFCIIGPPEEHVRRLRELQEVAGVNQFNIYLMSGEEEATIEAYGKYIISEMNKNG